MFKYFWLLFINFSVLKAQTIRQLKFKACATTCPACTQCDTKRGTCSIPLTGSTCQINSINGFCTSTGICNTQTNPPPIPLKKCQTYNCPTSTSCSVIYLNDGSDCTFPGNGIHSFCINDGCKAVIEALPTTLPAYNIGCLGLPDGVLCDTNLNLFDGEFCKNEICQLPNGNYNGVLPPL
jgi:hypothetical protein